MFNELVRTRRSIRLYHNKPVESEKIDLILETALRAPSSRGIRPWEFVVVQDRALIQKLSRSKERGSAFAASAQVVIVVCADTEKSDAWVEDASIAASMIFLAAHSLDLGACWVQIRNRQHDKSVSAEENVRHILAIPERISVLALIAIGYPAESLPPHPWSELEYKRIHNNHYGSLRPRPSGSPAAHQDKGG